MNDELKALLEEAYNRGASKSDLDQIVNRYNQKKKRTFRGIQFKLFGRTFCIGYIS